MSIGLTKAQAVHVAKVVSYIAVSAAISGLIALIAQNAALLGILTPFVNALLVLIQQTLKDPADK